jgi:hypothetical protein
MALLWDSPKKKVAVPTVIEILAGTGVVVAFSTRKLNSSSTLVLKACRSADNAETDISFNSSGLLGLDSVAAAGGTLGSWASGSTTVTVATWYDQSGNNLHASQSTLSIRPIIMNSGVLNTKNSLPSIAFADNRYVTVANNAALNMDTTKTWLHTGYVDNVSNYRIIFDKRVFSGFLAGYTAFLYPTTGNLEYQWNLTGSYRFAVWGSTPVPVGSLYTKAVRLLRSTGGNLKTNTTDKGTANFGGSNSGTSVNTNPLTIGGSLAGSASVCLVGGISDFIICNTQISDAVRTNYLTNAISHYGIT